MTMMLTASINHHLIDLHLVQELRHVVCVALRFLLCFWASFANASSSWSEKKNTGAKACILL